MIALGYTKGREICRQEIKTAGEPARIELSADRIKLSADGRDLVCITARLLDKEGTLVPRRRPEICFSVEGEGKFLGSGNGDALDHTLDASQVRTPFGGLCMAMAQSTESPGMLTVLASSNGLHTEKLCLKTE